MNSAPDWQSWTAIAAVIITALIFAVRSAGRKSGGCGSCACGRADDDKPAPNKHD